MSARASLKKEDWVYVDSEEDTVVVDNPKTPDRPITSTRENQKEIHRHSKSNRPANLLLDVLQQNGAPELARLLMQRKA